MTTVQLVKKFDLFSSPFTFFIDKSSKKKKTLLGGILSTLIITTSLGYFIYLLYLYFSNKILPKTTTSQYNELNSQTMVLQESLFAFQVISDGKTLEQIEKETGKKYLSYSLNHSNYSMSQEAKFKEIPLKKCEDNTNFSGFTCMDLQGLSLEARTLKQYPNGGELINYEFRISECKGLPNCANKTDIEDVILKIGTTFFVKISIQSNNQTSLQYQTSYKLDYYQFDNDLAILSTYNMRKSYTSVDQGLFLQGTVTTDQLVGVNRVDQFFSKKDQFKKIGYEGYFSLAFQLDQMCEITRIQFPMITEILSQFMSVFNIFLTVGILAQNFSESRIIEDVNTTYLKEYYKNTAIKLIYNKQKSAPEIKDQNSKGNVICQLQKEINDFDFVGKKKETFKINFGQRLKMLIFRKFNKMEKQTSQEQNIYQKMISQTIEMIDIQQVYKDLIKFKMAIKLILTKEQYVALQFCGCELNLKNKIKQEQLIEQQKEQYKNTKNDLIKPNNSCQQIKNFQNSRLNSNEDEEQKEKIYSYNECIGQKLQQQPEKDKNKKFSDNKLKDDDEIQNDELNNNQFELHQNHLNEIDDLVPKIIRILSQLVFIKFQQQKQTIISHRLKHIFFFNLPQRFKKIYLSTMISIQKNNKFILIYIRFIQKYLHILKQISMKRNILFILLDVDQKIIKI